MTHTLSLSLSRVSSKFHLTILKEPSNVQQRYIV